MVSVCTPLCVFCVHKALLPEHGIVVVLSTSSRNRSNESNLVLSDSLAAYVGADPAHFVADHLLIHGV